MQKGQDNGALLSSPCCHWDNPLSSLLSALIAFIRDTWLISVLLNSFQMVQLAEVAAY